MPDRTTATRLFAVPALFFLSLSFAVQAQPIEIHPRVGEQLEQNERDYFNLFRQWPAGAVKASRTVRNGIRFELAGNPEYNIIRPDEVLAALGIYLDRFEHLDDVVDSLDWGALNGVARYAKRYFPRSPYTFVSLSGAEREAVIVYSDEHLWVSSVRTFDWRSVEDSILLLDETRIARVTRRRHWLAITYRSAIAAAVTVLPWRASIENAGKYDIGRYIGVAGTSYAATRWALAPRRHSIAGQSWRYDLARLRIDRRAAFPAEFLAPELKVRIGHTGPELFGDDNDPPVRWRPGWYVAFSAAWMGLPGGRPGYYATGFGLPEFQHESADWTHIEVGRDYNERFSLSVESRFALDPESGEPVMDYSGLLVTALAEWHPWRPELHSFTRRFWVSLGAGPTFGRLVSGTVIAWTPQISSLEPSLEGRDEFVQSVTTGAIQIRGRASWAVNEQLSVTARASAWLPPFKLNGDSFRVGPVTYYEIDDFSLTYGISFGVVHRL